MSCGIYRIANRVNNKSYIGQSKTIEIRWKSHISDAFNIKSGAYDYPLQTDIREYGIENFTFSIVEYCSVNELAQKEQLYIDIYDTLRTGYNTRIAANQLKDTPSYVWRVINMLQNSTLSIENIADRVNVTSRTVRSINSGSAWAQNSIIYPIRPPAYIHTPDGKQRFFWYSDEYDKETNRHILLHYSGHDVDTPIERKRRYNGNQLAQKKGPKKNVSNKSKYIFYEKRKDFQCHETITKPPRDDLKYKIRHCSFEEIAKMYNTSSATIKRWCSKYHLPYRKNDIKRINDADWETI